MIDRYLSGYNKKRPITARFPFLPAFSRRRHDDARRCGCDSILKAERPDRFDVAEAIALLEAELLSDALLQRLAVAHAFIAIGSDGGSAEHENDEGTDGEELHLGDDANGSCWKIDSSKEKLSRLPTHVRFLISSLPVHGDVFLMACEERVCVSWR